jgi:hypothetical protein
MFFYVYLKLSMNNVIKPEMINLIGVAEDGNNHVIDERSNYDNYDYFKLNYIFKNERYCVLSENVPYIEDIDIRTHDVTRYLTSAALMVNDMEVDVTELVRQVAGPRCDFHGVLIDFNWMFPKCVGKLIMDFTNVDIAERVVVDVESNTITDGSRDIVPIVEYVNVDSEIELD